MGLGTKELPAHHLCSTAHAIIMKRLETYFSSSNSSNYPNKHQKEGSGETEKTLETKESNSNKTTKKSSYDQEDRTIKVRHFHPEWKNTFPWVIYNDGKMFCSTCLDFPEKSSDASSFTSSCSNFRMESLRSHAKSTRHIRAEEAISVKANPRNAPLPRALLLVSDEVRLKIEKLFDIAYMITKLKLPFTTSISSMATPMKDLDQKELTQNM